MDWLPEPGHLWLKSCIASQTENPLIKEPSTRGEALKSGSVLETPELQSQVRSVILVRMGKWFYNTSRRPRTAEVRYIKKILSWHTLTCTHTQNGKCGKRARDIAPLLLALCETKWFKQQCASSQAWYNDQVVTFKIRALRLAAKTCNYAGTLEICAAINIHSEIAILHSWQLEDERQTLTLVSSDSSPHLRGFFLPSVAPPSHSICSARFPLQ